MIKGEFMWVIDEEDKLLMKFKRSQKSGNSDCMLSKLDSVLRLWHARMGHVNYQVLTLMSKKRIVRCIPKVLQMQEICTGCLMAKQARKHKSKKSTFSAKQTLELIHADLCGPITL